MKTIFSLALSLTFLLSTFSFVFAQQDRWSYIGADVNQVEFFIDRKSIEPKGENLRAWHKTVYLDESYRISLLEWNCTEKKFFVVSETLYEPNGSPLGKDKTTEWLFVTPESINEGLYRAICNVPANNKAKPSADKIIVQIVAKTANLRVEPNVNGSVIRTAKLGEKFILADENPTRGWYRIILPKTNNSAWIHGNTIKLIEMTVQPKMKSKPNAKRKSKKWD